MSWRDTPVGGECDRSSPIGGGFWQSRGEIAFDIQAMSGRDDGDMNAEHPTQLADRAVKDPARVMVALRAELDDAPIIGLVGGQALAARGAHRGLERYLHLKGAIDGVANPERAIALCRKFAANGDPYCQYVMGRWLNGTGLGLLECGLMLAG